MLQASHIISPIKSDESHKISYLNVLLNVFNVQIRFDTFHQYMIGMIILNYQLDYKVGPEVHKGVKETCVRWCSA